MTAEEMPISCDLCNQYTPAKDNKLFGVRKGVLVALDRDWLRKSGTRHVCEACIQTVFMSWAEDGLTEEEKALLDKVEIEPIVNGTFKPRAELESEILRLRAAIERELELYRLQGAANPSNGANEDYRRLKSVLV